LLLAVVAAFVGPAVQSGWQTREVRQGARQLSALMRNLRERAVRTGTDQELVIEADGKTLYWSNGGSGTLPEAAWVTGVRGGWVDADGRLRLGFYQNGGATGVALKVALRTDDGYALAIEVDPLLGSVRISDVTR
jgi:Tfp pilus assembly protein FimT